MCSSERSNKARLATVISIDKALEMYLQLITSFQPSDPEANSDTEYYETK